MNGDCPDHLYSTIFTLKDGPGILLEALKPFAVSYYRSMVTPPVRAYMGKTRIYQKPHPPGEFNSQISIQNPVSITTYSPDWGQPLIVHYSYCCCCVMVLVPIVTKYVYSYLPMFVRSRYEFLRYNQPVYIGHLYITDVPTGPSSK